MVYRSTQSPIRGETRKGSKVTTYRITDKEMDLKEVQAEVCGHVVAIRIQRDHVMLVDEDGLMKNLAENKEATLHLIEYGIDKLLGCVPVVGNALVIKGAAARKWGAG